MRMLTISQNRIELANPCSQSLLQAMSMTIVSVE